MPERQIVGPPATTGVETPKLTRQPDLDEGDEATQEIEGNEGSQYEIVEVLLGALLQLLVAKRIISAEEFETFVQNVMHGGVDIESKKQNDAMAGPQLPQGGQQGGGFPGSGNQPGMGASPGFGQNNLQK